MCFFLATEKSSSPALLKFPVTISLWKEQSKLFQIADLIREMSCFGKKKVFRIVPHKLFTLHTHTRPKTKRIKKGNFLDFSRQFWMALLHFVEFSWKKKNSKMFRMSCSLKKKIWLYPSSVDGHNVCDLKKFTILFENFDILLSLYMKMMTKFISCELDRSRGV